LKNLRIRLKLLCGFMVVALITGVVGAIGITELSVMASDNEKSRLINDNGLRVGDAAKNLQAQRAAYRGAALDVSLDMFDEARQELDLLEELDAGFEACLSDFDRNFLTEKGREHAGIVKSAYAEYKAARERFTDAVKLDDLGHVMPYLRELIPLAKVVADDLNALVDYVHDTTAGIADASGEAAKLYSAVMLAAVLAGVAAAVLMGFYIAALIAGPTRRLAAAADLLAAGDTNIDIAVDSRDEIGKLAASFKKITAAAAEQARVLGLAAEGDYREMAPVRSGEDIINRSINALISRSSEVLLEIRRTAAQVSNAATQISGSAQSLASGASEQAASLQQFSSSIETVLNGAEKNMEQSGAAYGEVLSAKKHMEESERSMDAMTDAMNEISRSSDDIGKIIKVIDDIAFQTNILALNAAVEAARAGEHGKGFAVVADEVRNLASKSAEAARETSALIEGSGARVAEGSSIVGVAAENMRAVGKVAEDNAVTLQSISTMSKEQVSSISEINTGLGQISAVVQSTSAAAEESAAAAQEMSAQAAMLEKMLEGFKLSEGGPNERPGVEPEKRGSGMSGEKFAAVAAIGIEGFDRY
jgi:methyl-accepting chemotaxis protein